MSEDVKVEKDEADKGQFDGLAVINKDPAYHYRWARKRDVNIARHKYRGYEVVDSTVDKAESVLSDTTKMKKGTDNTSAVEVADMILMRIPKERHEALLRERQEKIRRQTRSVSAGYKQAVNQVAGQQVAFEEHRDNKDMRGMSEAAYKRYQAEKAHEEGRRR